MNYTLDNDGAAAAKQAEYTGSRIDKSGKYIGKFLYAESITAKTGAVGIEFNFEDADGLTTKLTIYTLNKDGAPIFGKNMLMAIMTCMKVKEIKEEKQTISKYVYEEKKEMDIETGVYPALHNKPIGLLLQAEEYAKSGGGIGIKMNIAGSFEVATGLTASEILDKKVAPEKLPKMLAALRDKKLPGAAPQHAQSTAARAGGALSDLDDDIPF
jgi:hypothetical protein